MQTLIDYLCNNILKDLEFPWNIMGLELYMLLHHSDKHTTMEF